MNLSLSALSARREELRRLVEDALVALVSEATMVRPLGEAVRYALFPGGKRIRPVLALCVSEDLGVFNDTFLTAAATLELIQCSSLVHDDLPCMDDDDMRRGRPSLHRAFNEATALLAGDYLVAYSFRILSLLAAPPELRSKYVGALSSAYLSLCNGQQLDILTGEERGDLALIHQQKTGALFSATMCFGGINVRGSEELLQMLSEVGNALGYAFQLLDDYLDVFAPSEVTGRIQSSDEKNHKETLFQKGVDQKAGRGIVEEAKNRVERLLSLVEKREGRTLSLTRDEISSIFERLALS